MRMCHQKVVKLGMMNRLSIHHVLHRAAILPAFHDRCF